MIHLIDCIDTLKSWRASLQSDTLGFVPTMGNLHQGHLSLVKKSLQDNAQTMVSIFVNPRQFGAHEDFDQYPRTLEKDLEALKSLSPGRPLTVFAPKKFYPKNFATTIKVDNDLTQKLCGQSRPQHFAGVTTVVYLLFSLVRPSKAYFGQKDYQQFKVVEKMTEDLRLPVLLEMMPIIRDNRGLALSSRNQYLTSEQYEQALVLSKTLNEIASDPKSLRPQHGWDYLEVLDAMNLQPISPDTKKILIAGAIKIGDVRLIDNIIINNDAG